MTATSCFVEISKEVFDNLLDNSTTEKTKKATKYGMKIFHGKFCFFLLVDKITTFLNKFKTNQALLFSMSLQYIVTFYVVRTKMEDNSLVSRLRTRWTIG